MMAPTIGDTKKQCRKNAVKDLCFRSAARPTKWDTSTQITRATIAPVRKVHPEVAGNEGEWQEHRCHDCQPVDHLTLALGSGRAECLDRVARLVSATVRRVEEGDHVTAMGIEVLLGPGLHTREPVDIAENAYQVSSVGPERSHEWGEQLANFEDLLKVTGHGRTPDDRCLPLVEPGVE